MRESELLRRIYDRSADLTGSGPVVVGPGDDAAVLRAPAGGSIIITTDQLVEGRHHERGTDPDAVARKAVARSVSDIAAMAGSPSWALACALLNDDEDRDDELFDATAAWARRFNCPLVGGDIARSPGPTTLTITVAGEPHARRGPVLRSTARAGDAVYVTGAVGGSLASGRHLTFEPRVDAARELADVLAEQLSAMIDLSDGLGIDAGRVAHASGVTLELDASALPLHPDAGPWRDAIAHGEDYELLFTAAPGATVPAAAAGTPVTRIGVVVEPGADGPTALIVAPGGERLDAARLGWDHGS